MAQSLDEIINGLSNFAGNNSNELDSYTGFNDPNVDFGKAGGSFFNMNVDEPFQLRIVNAHATFNFYVWLTFGLDYNPGTTAGQIVAGAAFAGENAGDGVDPGTNITVTAPVTTQSMRKYIQWVTKKSSIISKLEITPDDPSTFYKTNMISIREDLMGPDRPKVIPMRKYADKNAYNLQFADIYEQAYLSDQHIVKIVAPANSTTDINLYLGASISQPKQLERKVADAMRNGVLNQPLKDAIQAAGRLKELQARTSSR